MMKRTRWMSAVVLAAVVVISPFGIQAWVKAGDAPKSGPNRSGIVTWEQAKSNTGEWGEMRVFFEGETFGTTQNLAALAVIKPGQALHPAHRHAEEEYLVITEGSGVWHLDGKEYPAKKGDVLYTEPWVMHGLVNTGSEPLTFFVVKWNSKGVTPPPEPAGDHGK
ncbi:MAG TPA: cupin domain-containing protein [bacterium]|nr:cupin domain-containing protein [bacterium]